MEVKPGYKLTEVGVIPEEWLVRPLSEVAQVRSGIAKNSNVSVTNPILVHYLRVANVQDGFLDLSEMSQLEVSQSDLQRFAVLPGDVLMNEGGDRDKLGRGSIWRGEYDPCVHQNHVFVVRCGPTVAPGYLATWSAGPVAKRYFLVAGKQTTNLASINKTALGRLPVVVPSPDEQRAIASTLSDVDALIDSLDRLIAKKRDLKQAAMQQLLTGKKRLPGFTGEWGTHTFGEMFDILRNASYSRSELADHGDVGCLHYGDIHTHPSAFLNCSSQLQTFLAPGRIASTPLMMDGDLVMVDASEDTVAIGKAVEIKGLNERKAIAGLHTLLLRARPGFLADGFKGYLQHFPSVRSALVRFATGVSVYGVSKTNIKTIEVTIPEPDEQAAIAKVLSDMDAEIAALEARRDKTRALKQGMMQELLTGRTRLV